MKEYQGQKLSPISAFRENSIKGPQHIDIETYRLKITGLVASPASSTYDEVISQYPHHEKVVRMECVEGWGTTILWEGVLAGDLLAKARPLPEAKIAICRAYDGDTTSLPIEYLTGRDVLLAYKMNEVILPPERGFPFHLVAEGKWGYKWLRWLTEIELSADAAYRCFWESRGYANGGDLDKGFLGD